MLLCALPMSAQKLDYKVFDFTNPYNLTPSVTPKHGNANVVLITDLVFKNGPIRISFERGAQPTGAQIATIGDGANETYHLRVTATTSMTFSTVDGARIQSIKFSDDSEIGDLYLKNGEPGEQLGEEGNRKWECKGADVDSVTFYNNSQMAKLKTIRIDYITPSDILVPISDINNDDVIPFFKDIKLTFKNDMTMTTSKGIKVENSDGSISKPLSATLEGKEITLSLEEKIEIDDTYTVTVPAKCFKDKDGYENTELKYTFKVVIPKNTFGYTSVTPNTGKVEVINDSIILEFPSAVGHVDSKMLVLKKDNADFRPIKMTKLDGSDNKVVITFVNVNSAITEDGEFTIEVPEGSIFNAFYDTGSMSERYNPEFVLAYTISSNPVDPDPGTDPEPLPDSETMKAAKELLNVVGVGYPSENSSARVALKAAVESQVTPSDDELNRLMADFYAEKEVALPETDKWFSIAGTNNNGELLYLSYNEGRVSLDSDIANAAPFKATLNADSTVVFETYDGLYMHVLSSEDNKYDATSSRNVTETLSEVNNLTLSKFVFSSVDSKKTFGLWSIKGGLGKDKVTGQAKSAYAALSLGGKSVATDPSYELLFGEDFSSAFTLTEVEQPMEAVDLEYTLTPDIIEGSGNLTLTFQKGTDFTVSEDADAYFADLNGTRKKKATINIVDSFDNVFTIPVSDMSIGQYTIVIPEGTFKCKVDGEPKKIKKITKPFRVKEAYQPSDDFIKDFSFIILNDVNVSTPVTDESLNELVIYVNPNEYSKICANPNMYVSILKYTGSEKIRDGHFEPYEIPGMELYPALKLVLDTPIEYGELKPTQYTYVLQPGTIGNEEFGMYLNDPTSIDPSKVIVNPFMTITRIVDNELAAGINNVTVDENSDCKIYDITGRRVTSVKKNGIYIINGKKFVK